MGCIGNTLSTVPFHEEPSRPYYALIYLYRPASFAAGGEPWEVSLDDNVVGRIFPDAYMTIHAAPGTHWFKIGEGAPFMLAVSTLAVGPVVLGAAVVGAAVGGAAAAAGVHEEPETMEFKARSGEVYYLRCRGKEREFVTREQAIDTLRTMKYDRGD